MNRLGFTLLELSIVLVIIGLIIGGITVGQDLIRAAEINSVASDFQKYQVTLNSFKLKYNSLPGDIGNATAYWPTASTGNGDKNGVINDSGSGSNNEALRAWQHLGLAELIPGNYNGVVPCLGSGTCFSALGNSHPPARIANAGFSFLSNNYLSIGSLPDNAIQATSGVFTGADASTIDTKIDDGVAATGIVRGVNELSGGGTACLSSGVYDLASTVEDCVIQHKY